MNKCLYFAIVFSFMVISAGCSGGGSSPQVTTVVLTSAPLPTYTLYPTYTPYPTFTQPALPAEVPITETPAPAILPTLSPDIPTAFTGSGDKVLDVAQWGSGIIVIVCAQPEDNFFVTPFDANGESLYTIVNVIVGEYIGIKPINWDGEKAANIQVEANQIGSWSITYTPIDSITNVLTVPGKWEDAMDNVFRLDGFSGGAATITHDGESNFIVTPYDSNLVSLYTVVNEIGPYSGTVMLPKETSYLVVEADGKWSIEIPGN